jgi:hypothetical protein
VWALWSSIGIKGGTVFTTPIQRLFGRFVRHSFVIQTIRANSERKWLFHVTGPRQNPCMIQAGRTFPEH